MNMARVVLTSIMLALVPAAAAEAQSASADTLRYGETTVSETVLETPQGEISMRSEHAADIGFLAVGPDSAHAWYDRISVAAMNGMEEHRPDITMVEGDLFVLRFDEKGHVETVATPDFPDSLEGITDLRYQFVDFFMPKPPEPLRVGLAWSDTLVIDQSDSEAGASGGIRTAVRYRVVADTTMDSVPVFVVEAAGEVEVWTEGPVPGQPGLSMRMALSGPEANTFHIAKSDGRLVARTRSAELEGTLSYFGAPQPVQMRVRQSYENEIRLRTGQDPDAG